MWIIVEFCFGKCVHLTHEKKCLSFLPRMSQKSFGYVQYKWELFYNVAIQESLFFQAVEILFSALNQNLILFELKPGVEVIVYVTQLTLGKLKKENKLVKCRQQEAREGIYSHSFSSEFGSTLDKFLFVCFAGFFLQVKTHFFYHYVKLPRITSTYHGPQMKVFSHDQNYVCLSLYPFHLLQHGERAWSTYQQIWAANIHIWYWSILPGSIWNLLSIYELLSYTFETVSSVFPV